jgi:hypothetical protein
MEGSLTVTTVSPRPICKTVQELTRYLLSQQARRYGATLLDTTDLRYQMIDRHMKLLLREASADVLQSTIDRALDLSPRPFTIKFIKQLLKESQ